MPEVLNIPVSTAAVPSMQSNGSSDSTQSKANSSDNGFSDILKSKTVAESGKSVVNPGSTNALDNRVAKLDSEKNSQTKKGENSGMMDATLEKAFGENRGAAAIVNPETGGLQSNPVTEFMNSGSQILINPISGDMIPNTQNGGIISNFGGVLQQGEMLVNGIGPPGAMNSPPSDFVRIETAGPRGNTQNPQTEQPRFTEEAESQKTHREVSIKTTQVFDWMKQNFKTPAGEITRGDVNRMPVAGQSDSFGLKSEISQSAQSQNNAAPRVSEFSDNQVKWVVADQAQPLTQVSGGQVQDTLTGFKPYEMSGTGKEISRSGQSQNDAAKGVSDFSRKQSDAPVGNSAPRITQNSGQNETSGQKIENAKPVQSQDNSAQTIVESKGSQNVKLQSDQIQATVKQSVDKTQETVKEPGIEISKPEVAQDNTAQKKSGASENQSSGLTANQVHQKIQEFGGKILGSVSGKAVEGSGSVQATTPTGATIVNQVNPSLAGETPEFMSVKVEEPVSVLGNAPMKIASEIKNADIDSLPQGAKAVLKIELSPPRLGRMNIELVKTEFGMDVKLLVRTAFARDLLMQRGEEIKTALHDLGIEVRRFSIVEVGQPKGDLNHSMSGFESNAQSHHNDGNLRGSNHQVDDNSLDVTDAVDENASIQVSPDDQPIPGGLDVLA